MAGPVQQRDRQQAAGEHALGEKTQARARAGDVFEAHLVAHRFTHGFAALGRYEARRQARSQAARFQHQHLAIIQFQQRRRHPRGLSRARRRFQHKRTFCPQVSQNVGDQGVDGQAHAFSSWHTRRYTGIFVDSLSYLRGASIPLLEKTLSQALADTAALYPHHDALIVCHQGARFTWAQLDAAVTRTARGLAGLGLQPGDRAGIWASNCAEWVLLQYAAARAGVVLVNVNPAYRSHELRYVLKKSHMRALFLREKDARADYRAILAESRNGDTLPLEHVIWLGDGFVADHARPRRGSIPPMPPTTHDVANIQYTSAAPPARPRA